MTSQNFVVFENEKFVRVSLANINVGELYSLLTSKKYACFFGVFNDNPGIIRYKLPKICNDNDFKMLFSTSILNVSHSGVNSEDFDVSEALYLDCYKNTLNNQATY